MRTARILSNARRGCASGLVRPRHVDAEAHALHERGHQHQRREADDGVDDIGGGSPAEDVRQDVAVEQADHGPVPSADHYGGEPQRLESLEDLHRMPPSHTQRWIVTYATK